MLKIKMLKIQKLLIISILFCSTTVLNAGEIKEVKLLDDFSNEIIGKSEVSKGKKLEITKNKNNETNKEIITHTREKTNYDIDSIVEIFDKVMVDGIAYKKDSNAPFTGIFGAVINDKINYIETYKDGLLDGESAWFSREGVKLLSENYSKGKLNGEQRSYYENAKLKSIVKYKNNRVDGIVAYDESGKILHESIFKNGTGSWKFFWSNGKLAEEGRYTAWRKDGVWKSYRKDGSLDITRTYNKGRLLKERWE